MARPESLLHNGYRPPGTLFRFHFLTEAAVYIPEAANRNSHIPTARSRVSFSKGHRIPKETFGLFVSPLPKIARCQIDTAGHELASTMAVLVLLGNSYCSIQESFSFKSETLFTAE
jgi:hypothetical protein